MDQTNKATLPDLDSFFLNQGKPVGYDPSDAEIEMAKAILVPVTKELMMRQFAPPQGAERLGARTNEVTRDVLRTVEYSDGSFKPYEVPMLQTTDGYQELVAPGTTRGVANIDTSAAAKGYVASGSFYGMGQPVVGGDNSAARDAAAAATASPTPTPQPYAMTNAEGTAMSFASPYDVRAAFKQGGLTQDEARKALSHFGIK